MIHKENQDDLMKGRVMHSLPGRLRLEAKGLKYLQEESAEIASELARIPGVRRARVTPCWMRWRRLIRPIWCWRGTQWRRCGRGMRKAAKRPPKRR